MKIIQPSTQILTSDLEILSYPKMIERAGRVCYKSEDKMSEGTSFDFCRKIMTMEHESVIEHCSITVLFICDRGVSHELVRHRLASFSQESTRYCNYSKDKFDNEITVIEPFFFRENLGSSLEVATRRNQYAIWQHSCQEAELAYFSLLRNGATPQEARSVLPNSLKTEIVVTANLREWRHIFRLRTSSKAHPQMRELMVPLHQRFATLLPEIFGQ